MKEKNFNVNKAPAELSSLSPDCAMRHGTDTRKDKRISVGGCCVCRESIQALRIVVRREEDMTVQPQS